LLPINIDSNTYTAIHRDRGAIFFCSIQQGKYTVRAIVRRRRRHRRRRRRRRSVLDWLFSDAVIFFIHRAVQAVL